MTISGHVIQMLLTFTAQRLSKCLDQGFKELGEAYSEYFMNKIYYNLDESISITRVSF